MTASVTQDLDTPGIEGIGIVVGLLLGGAYAGLDAAIGAVGEARLLAVRDAGGVEGRVAARVLDQGQKIQARYLAGRTFCAAAVAGLSVYLGLQLGPSSAVVALFAMAFTYGLIAEIVTSIVRDRAAEHALHLVRWARPLEILVWPLAAPLAWIGAAVLRAVPSPPPAPTEESKELAALEVEHVIAQQAESGTFAEDDAELLRSVLDFRDTVAREVMVPRIAVKSIEVSTPLRKVLAFVREDGHSRYPVYRERVDQVEGVLYTKDLFHVIEQGKLDTSSLGDVIRRTPFFIVESQKIGDVLREMQHRRMHLAVVTDEFGGMSGIVALEDILEEIVGDIHDEHDEANAPVRQVAPGRYLADAGILVDDLERYLDSELRPKDGDKEYDTLAGMVMTIAGKVPGRGESVSVDGYELIVREADARRVTSVEIIRIAPSPALGEA